MGVIETVRFGKDLRMYVFVTGTSALSCLNQGLNALKYVSLRVTV